MPCYHPLKGWLNAEVNPDTGKRSITFDKSEALCAAPVLLPCGQCIGCRLEMSRQWAVRCVHEASMYDNNCFITLTFRDGLPPFNSDSNEDWFKRGLGSLVKRDFQLFMKRLRKRFGQGVRYFHCGEYGSKGERPHHHACLFNFRFPDLQVWSVRDNVKLYRSEVLEQLWPYGFCTVGDVTFESAAYVARYVTKKITGRDADKYYKGRVPEYITMSRRPGIGSLWYDKFKSDVYPHGFVVTRKGIKCRPPEYYERRFELTDKEEFDILKRQRVSGIAENPDNTRARLVVREEVHLLQAEKLERSFEA